MQISSVNSRTRLIVAIILTSGVVLLSIFIYANRAGGGQPRGEGERAATPPPPRVRSRFFKRGQNVGAKSKRGPQPFSRFRLVAQTGDQTAAEDDTQERSPWPNTLVNPPQKIKPGRLVGVAEPSIAATSDARRVVVGWNNVEGFLRPPFGDAPGEPGLSAYGYSTDGGTHWTAGGAPTVFGNVMTGGDPWLDRGGFDRGTFYMANLAFDVNDPFASITLGISVHRGRFGGGFSWDDLRLLKSPDYPQDYYDKGAVAAAKDGSGAAYVSLTNFRGICGRPGYGFGRIELWRTHDAGDTWQGPLVVQPDENFVTDPNAPDCGAEGILHHNSVPVVGLDGEACVVWARGPGFTLKGVVPKTDIMVSCTENGGRRIRAATRVARINSLAAAPPAAYDRSVMSDVPHIAIARTQPHRGRIYVAYYEAVRQVAPPATEQSPVSSQVFLSYSDDHGRTFSRPVAVAPPVTPEGVKRFWPLVNVTEDGAVNVVYYQSRERQTTDAPDDIECDVSLDGGGERRAGVVSSMVNVMVARSADGGETFDAPRRVTTTTSNWCRAVSNSFPMFGDYIGATAAGNHLLTAWTDTRNGWPDIFFANLNSGTDAATAGTPSP